jgi:hypothetical protein
MTFTSKQLSRNECLAQAEECRAMISTVSNRGTRIMLETVAQRWDRLADEPQRARG